MRNNSKEHEIIETFQFQQLTRKNTVILFILEYVKQRSKLLLKNGNSESQKNIEKSQTLQHLVEKENQRTSFHAFRQE